MPILNEVAQAKAKNRSPRAHQPPVLTIERVQRIFFLWGMGLSYRQIARELKLGAATVFLVVKAAKQCEKLKK